jgi:hypothetical protein
MREQPAKWLLNFDGRESECIHSTRSACNYTLLSDQ